jgi:predicted ATPase
VTKDKSLPPEVLYQIVARTDGVPLFIEELTKTVLESGLLREAGDRYELTGPLPPLAIPATLHAPLLARLDRLASVKDLAQIAAMRVGLFGRIDQRYNMHAISYTAPSHAGSKAARLADPPERSQ